MSRKLTDRGLVSFLNCCAVGLLGCWTADDLLCERLIQIFFSLHCQTYCTNTFHFMTELMTINCNFSGPRLLDSLTFRHKSVKAWSIGWLQN